jgi:hypothetical protein
MSEISDQSRILILLKKIEELEAKIEKLESLIFEQFEEEYTDV